MATTAPRPAPRERLLAAADELFYEEGVCSVGVDRVIKKADVARASLYSAFGSKEELVTAYLEQRSAQWQAYVAEVLPQRFATPADRLLGVFDLLGEWFAAPGYHGCPFINASAEARPGSPVEAVSDAHRAWVRSLFSDLGREAAARDPEGLADQLILLYDGSMVGAQLDRSPAPAQAARAAAAALLAGATATARRRRRER
jgi:AcrR family transcriptional regulator